MELLQTLAGPVVGAVIGYITNDIAIRMLFRPHKAVYVFGRRLPFTPGIVPRRKDQLAAILGEAIVEKFFNADDLEIVFTSGIADSVADSLMELLRSDVSISSLTKGVEQEKLEKLESELCVRIQAAVCTSQMPEKLLRESSSLLPESAAKALAHRVREFIIEHGYEYILPLLHSELQRAGEKTVGELTALLAGEDDEKLRESIKQLYLRFMQRHVRPIVESIDVGGMIREKIVLMSSEEVEELVLAVVNKELRLVVYFGAFLGALIGTVNIFI